MFNIDYDTEVYLQHGLTLEEADAMGVLGGHDYYLNVDRTISAKEDIWKFSVKDFQDDSYFLVEPTDDITEIIEFATQLLYDLIHGEPVPDNDEKWFVETQYSLNILEEAKERIIKRKEKKSVITR